MAEDAGKETFRDFNRREYEERRAEARLTPAQRTCTTLDEMAGITVSVLFMSCASMCVHCSVITHQFNVLWINPNDVDSVPKGLMAALLEYTQGISLVPSGRSNEATRLRDQMRADALQPVASDEDDNASNDHNGMNKGTQQEDFPVETVEEAAHFFRLRVCCNALSL